MNQQTFILKWQHDGKKFEKQVSRQTLRNLIEAVRAHFFEDNLVSTKFVKILFSVTSMEIDMDKNRNLEIPIVSYTANEKTGKIQVPRSQKIIWAILNECCKL